MELATPYYGAAAMNGASAGSPQAVAPASGPQGPAAFGFNFSGSGGLTSDHLPVIATVALLGLALLLLHARG